MHNDVNKGEKKVMNNNPTVASVNLVHDIVGDSDKGLGFKVVVGVLTTLMVIIGIALVINDRILTGIIIVLIGLTLLF
ncbi:MAG: hypothetical protein J1F17_03200, partial [Oscillospiraceae bacterium]|nr:hypothetical protein [Oscillospiraceae bacterium]